MPEQRGEALFSKPFPHDPALSCAGCHVPSAAFVDHQQHDVGSGGLFKTPTLRNADFNAPYFHDGRFDNFDQVVDYFDRIFQLGLSAQDKGDLVAYLTAVGDGVQPYERDGAGATLKEINDFSSVLATAIPADDKDIVALAVDTIGRELRELTERYPDRKNTSVSGGEQQRGACAQRSQGAGADAAADRYGRRSRTQSLMLPTEFRNYRISDGCRRSRVAGQRRAVVAVQSRRPRSALRCASRRDAVQAHSALIELCWRCSRGLRSVALIANYCRR